ncbi:MAG: sulfate adenylyltransferase [Nitrososphaerales archaeon]
MVIGDPYGGKLVNKVLSTDKAEEKTLEAKQMPQVKPFIDFIYDAEKIAIGAYSPLEGFMGSDSLNCVLEENRLPNGLPWTIPIVLAVQSVDIKSKGIREGQQIALLDFQDRPFAILDIDEIFHYSKDEFAEDAYGSRDTSHPNVYDIFNNYGDIALAGSVTLIRKLKLPTVNYELSPEETRGLFKSKGWKNVVAYQCRNPPHTAHEYIQKVSLENSDIDGLFIHPVIGRLKKGDYKPAVIMDAYKEVVSGYYPGDKATLSSLSITMRYAGPKAALFFAIVRKNYGATHYIVGRDQAGVGKFYDPYACHRIFDEYDVGIIPLKYQEAFYCQLCKSMATERTCPHPISDHLLISQTKMRELLKEGRSLPSEILRPEVIKILSRGDVILD